MKISLVLLAGAAYMFFIKTPADQARDQAPNVEDTFLMFALAGGGWYYLTKGK